MCIYHVKIVASDSEYYKRQTTLQIVFSITFPQSYRFFHPFRCLLPCYQNQRKCNETCILLFIWKGRKKRKPLFLSFKIFFRLTLDCISALYQGRFFLSLFFNDFLYSVQYSMVPNFTFMGMTEFKKVILSKSTIYKVNL